MEFSKLGRHCALESCHRLDFLPFQCDHCHASFCLEHRTVASHSCASAPAPSPPPSLVLHSYINPHRCQAPHCHKREALPNACRNCGMNHCLAHRFPTSHACSAKLPNNVILRKGGAAVPQLSTLLAPVAEQSAQCSTEARAEERRNTNVAAHSRLLQQQKAH